MYQWILILTIIQGLNGGGPAVHSVPDFHTREACMHAGQTWASADKPDDAADYRYACVPRSLPVKR
jgi:hypothetical protein